MVYGGGGNAGPHALNSIVGTYNGVTNPTFTYDNDGNMLTGANMSFGVTSFGQTSTITQGTTQMAELAYGAFHQRYKMCVPNCATPTTTTDYLADPMTGMYSEKMVSGSATTYNDYIVVPGAGIVAVRIKNGGTVFWRYAGVDHLGSVVTLTDPQVPSVTERNSYDPWGKRRNADGSDNTTCAITSQISRGFTGQEMLDSVCLINMNARLYDPSPSRFMSADDRLPNLYGTADHNRYSYVYNNPLNATDPSGHGGGATDDSISAMLKEWIVCAAANCYYSGNWPVIPDGNVDDGVYDGNNNWGSIPAGDEYMGGANPGIPGGGTHGGGGQGAMGLGNDGGNIETVVVTANRIPAPTLPTTIVGTKGPCNTTNTNGAIQDRARFFTHLPELNNVAQALGVPNDYVVGLSSFESGWLDDHNVALNNLWGLTNDGGNNINFSSFASGDKYFLNRVGPYIKGANTISAFEEGLRKEGYNSKNPNYWPLLTDRIENIEKWEGRCGIQ
jgi:RHS repeat-associated protein